MGLSTDEINKVNELYRQLDVITAENRVLREHSTSATDIARVEEKVDSVVTILTNIHTAVSSQKAPAKTAKTAKK